MTTKLIDPVEVLGIRRFELETWKTRNAISPGCTGFIYYAAEVEFKLNQATQSKDQLQKLAYLAEAEIEYARMVSEPVKHGESEKPYERLADIVRATMSSFYLDLQDVISPKFGRRTA